MFGQIFENLSQYVRTRAGIRQILFGWPIRLPKTANMFGPANQTALCLYKFHGSKHRRLKCLKENILGAILGHGMVFMLKVKNTQGFILVWEVGSQFSGSPTHENQRRRTVRRKGSSYA